MLQSFVSWEFILLNLIVLIQNNKNIVTIRKPHELF